jgi:hypothetical protein
VTLTYTITHDNTQPGGTEAPNDSVTYQDDAGHTVTFGSPTVDVRGCDGTGPDAACVETANPSGKNVPKAGPNAGKSGQNPDGFYLINASDAESGVASIVLKDGGSDASFELSDGDKIKLIQAPGVEPSMEPGPGDIDWLIKFKGEATLVVTDNAGNVNETSCLVLPPAK